jgi:hypothetical protein
LYRGLRLFRQTVSGAVFRIEESFVSISYVTSGIKPMSKSQREKQAEEGIPDPTKALQEMYEKFWKQTAEQWDEVARSPQALSMMAANLNQSLELKARVQETVVALLRTMNIPTRDDLAAVTSRLDEIGDLLGQLNQKLDKKTAVRSVAIKAKKPAQRKAGKRARKKA